MLDDNTLIQAIDKSPLKPEDKEHWKNILYKLNSDQKERLLNSLTSKTEIYRVIGLIERALKIISQAEQDAEAEIKEEKETNTEKEELLKELEEIKNTEHKIELDEESLKKQQQETQDQITKLRQDLHQLSMEAHGAPPPSYVPGPQIPQLQKPQ
jgi:chromosome segregation ATPase